MVTEWQERLVETPSARFVVREAGDGPPLIWLHDEISSAPGAAAAALTGTHRVVAPVHPGFGSADRPEWVESVRDLADTYLDLLEHESLRGRPVLAGVSMGAWVACELALRIPDRVTALVLVAPVGVHVPGHSPADYWFVRDRDSVLFNDLEAMPRLTPEETVANEESAARYGWAPRLHDPTLAPRLHRLRMPTQIVWAGDDGLLPRAHLERWRGLLPHAVVTEIAGTGHFPVYERSEETAAAITEFTAKAAPHGATSQLQSSEGATSQLQSSEGAAR